ncbi:hypothetical protein SFOMI_0003 [Sphingobium fuliginis]|uniref:Uncharacterized protein n=1 Tax=Sphingobium fuliginis (strain ATCC 27551) TaxID=336203 RepID=A0A292Z9K9_SPHSA|nr:hypothetical protein SFOMI_0003 [Sphingobium fuliginis]
MMPGELQLADIAVVDLGKRTIVVLIDPAIARPIAPIAPRLTRRRAGGEQQQQGQKEAHETQPPMVRSEGQKRWRSAFLLTLPMTVRPMSSTIS